MDGMYIVPLGIPIEQRTDAGCLHKITLAPPGISATDIFDLVIDDIIFGMTDGVDVYLEGEKCRLFLDLICYIGDSPALACFTGCKGHSSDTPCHVCGFRRDKLKKVQIVSSNGATSSQSAERRSVRRVLDIHASANGAEDIDKIGISNVDSALLRLSKKLKEAREIPKTSNGRDVVPKSFDAYISSLISPDHVFLGLIGNILEVLLRLMKPKEREEFDRNCVEILRRNDLYNRSSILNADRNILKSTISEAFAIIFVCPTVLSCMKLNLRDNNVEEQNIKSSKKKKPLTKKSGKEIAFRIVLELIDKLNDVIIQAQSNPDMSIDSKSDLDIFNDGNGRRRLENLVKNSNEYAALIERLANEDVTSASILDKPNIHRFIELFIHTLPMVGSLKYIEELILEKGHQSAKKAVDMSNQKNEQLQAMNDYLHDDLIARLKSITREYPVIDKDAEMMLKSELKGLVGIIDTQDNLIFPSLNNEVVQTIRMIGKDICNRDDYPMWIVEETQSADPIEYKETMEKALSNMEALICKESERERWEGDVIVRRGYTAVFKTPKGELERFQRHTKLIPNDVLEVSTSSIHEKYGYIYRRREFNGDRIFLRVIGFIHTVQDARKVVYCVGHLLTPCISRAENNPHRVEFNADNAEIEERCSGVHKINEDVVVTLELCPGVRKAFKVDASLLRRISLTEAQNETSCNSAIGNRWIVKGRREGFPPRRG